MTEMNKLKIVFLGTPIFVQPIKEALAKNFTLVDSLEKADPDLIGADLAVVAAYGRILNKNELNTPKYGCINIHPSLLPKYRGPSPIQSAILNGDKISGITIIKMDEDIDHGPIIYQEQIELSNDDNFDILSKKMFRRSAKVLPKIIEGFTTKKINPVPQDHLQATFCIKLTRNSGYFDINNLPEAEKLDRMIRAFYPWPGVWCKWKDKIVKFLPGNLIQMEGKKIIPMKDFLNGYPDFPLKEF